MLDTVKINHVQHISFTQSRLTDAVSVILSELLSYEHPSNHRGSHNRYEDHLGGCQGASETYGGRRFQTGYIQSLKARPQKISLHAPCAHVQIQSPDPCRQCGKTDGGYAEDWSRFQPS